MRFSSRPFGRAIREGNETDREDHPSSFDFPFDPVILIVVFGKVGKNSVVTAVHRHQWSGRVRL